MTSRYFDEFFVSSLPFLTDDVIPAQAGIQWVCVDRLPRFWISAFAGMTVSFAAFAHDLSA